MNFASSPDLLEKYLETRQLSSDLCKRAMNSVTHKDTNSLARSLNILKQGNVVFKNESEMANFLDCVMFHIYKGGFNTITHYLSVIRSKLSEKEIVVAESLCNANFYMYEIKKQLPHGGLLVQDIIDGNTFLLIDKTMSSFEYVVLDESDRLVLGSMLLNCQDFFMTTGSALVIVDSMFQYFRHAFGSIIGEYKNFCHAPKRVQSKFVIEFVKSAFEVGSTEYVQYESVEDSIEHES